LSGPARHLARVFVGAAVAAGAALLWRPVLTSASPSVSVFVPVLGLVPMLWMAAIDHLACTSRMRWADAAAANDRRALAAALLTAPFLTFAYAAIAYARMLKEGAAALPVSGF